MELTGQRRLPIDRASAWTALNDPEMLRVSIPGCESIDRVAENEYAVLLAAALGPVRAKFRGKLKVEDIVAPESYSLRFEGEGGAAGFAKGTAKVRLSDDSGGTQLDYLVSSQVGGKLAQVGNRLIDSAARKLAEDFFASFEQRLAPPSPAARLAATPKPAPVARYLVIMAIAAVIIAIIAALGH